MTAIVENPVGPIVLGVDPDNPYKDVSSPVDLGDTRYVYFGDQVTRLSDDDIDRAVELDRRSTSMKILTYIDGMFGILNFAATGSIFSVLACVVSYFGYKGAVIYSRNMVISYLWYQIVLTFGRFSIFVMAIHDHAPTKLLILLPVMAIVQAYITWYVYKFYSLLPKNCIEYIPV